MEAPQKKSLAELRAEVKQIRKELYKPISRSKKGELEAEIARHKGITAPTSTKEEKVEVKPKKEKKTKEVKEEATPEKRTKGKKVEPKKAEPKKEEKKVAKKDKKKD